MASIVIGAMLCLSPIQSHADEANAVIISIKLSDQKFGAPGETFDLHGLEERIGDAIGYLGDVDGDEAGEGFFSIYVYTNYPNQLLSGMHSVLFDGSIPTGSFVEIYNKATWTKLKRIELPNKK